MFGIGISFLFWFIAVLVKADDPLCVGLPKDEVVLFPSPVYCNHYYKCYNGVFTEERCNIGFYYSDFNKKCVEPQYAECMGGSGAPEPIESTTTSIIVTSTTTQESDSTSKPSTTLTPETSTSSTTYTPKTSTTTTTTTTYVPDSTTSSSTTSSEFTTTRTTHTPGTSTTDLTTSTSITNSPTTPEDVDPRCTNMGTSYWPHPSECHLYIECYQGHFYEMACPSNKYFSDSHKRCVDASESECCQSKQCIHQISKINKYLKNLFFK